MKTPGGSVSMRYPLTDCLAIKRSACVAALLGALSRTRVDVGFDFARFSFDGAGAVAAVEATTGAVEEGDLFVAADGAFSRIRALLFPAHELRCSPVKEIVGSTDRLPLRARDLARSLIKTQCSNEPLSFGLLPCSAGEIVWYMQFRAERATERDLAGPGERRAFVTEALDGWPDPTAEVLGATDFGRVFVWSARDLDPLPALSRDNVVLIGDAAHLTLPFTSQGATSALCDAVTLVDALRGATTEASLPGRLESYAARRRPALARHLEYGRRLESRFLNPEAHRNEAALIPFSPDPRDASERGVS